MLRKIKMLFSKGGKEANKIFKAGHAKIAINCDIFTYKYSQRYKNLILLKCLFIYASVILSLLIRFPPIMNQILHKFNEIIFFQIEY
jgi:hypothetical protein